MDWTRLVQSVARLMLPVCASLPCFSTAQTDPPKARVDNVVDEYHGVKITDPYRWLEDLKSEEVRAWMKAHAVHAESVLSGLPQRDDFLRRLKEVSSAGAAVNAIRHVGGQFFFQRRAPDENDFRIIVREGLKGVERVLVDPTKLGEGKKRYSIAAWSVSPDARYLAYSISASGSEDYELRVVEVATGRDLGERIERFYGAAIGWLDGRSILVQRRRQLPENAPAVERDQKLVTYLHRLGENPEEAKPVFGYGINPDIPGGIDMLWQVETRPGWDFAVATMHTGVTPEKELFVAPLSALSDRVVPWRKIVRFEDKVSEFDIRGDELYLMSFRNTPRYTLVRTGLAKPELARAETVVPAGEAVLTAFKAQRDALYVTTLDGGNYRTWRVDYQTKRAEPLPLPHPGAAYLVANEQGTEGAYFQLNSWTRSRAHYWFNPKTGRAEPTQLIPPHPIDMSGMEFVNVKVRSHDGVMVPMVIIHKKGMVRDGNNPTLMLGYGAYGIENTSPVFNPRSLPWLERGGVFVWTGVRGGGEYGEDWHQAGKEKTKPNTWKDFIACAEYLIREKFTSARHLGIKGESAGGILISNAIAERPQLFGAAIIGVGMNNTLRYETMGNGPGNVPQFGSIKTEEGFRALLAMDGYHKIAPNVKYPAVLLTHGINDRRVDAWMSSKSAARLLASTTSGKPVLLRIDYDAGHGGGSTEDQRNAQQADELAFLWQQLRRPAT
ncbi:MAG: S9 family peptidase [Betaproteobacteria bacterium]|nr:S9 family peptidase [Betaproteobacteria bacterium]